MATPDDIRDTAMMLLGALDVLADKHRLRDGRKPGELVLDIAYSVLLAPPEPEDSPPSFDDVVTRLRREGRLESTSPNAQEVPRTEEAATSIVEHVAQRMPEELDPEDPEDLAYFQRVQAEMDQDKA